MDFGVCEGIRRKWKRPESKLLRNVGEGTKEK